MLFLRITLLSILLFVPRAFAEPPASGVGVFALSFAAENWKKCPEIGALRCVLGKLPKNQSLQLLGSETSTSCRANTTRSFESKWESGSFPLTFVDAAACQKFRFHLAAKSDKQLPYQLLDGKSLPSPPSAIARDIDAKIRRSAPTLEPSGTQHELALASTSPSIFRLPSMDQDTFIAVFENSATPGDQVHFLYTRGKVKLIHSAASISSIFSLGNEYFIHYSFTCRIGCGYWGEFVAKFSNTTFRVVMFDASTST